MGLEEARNNLQQATFDGPKEGTEAAQPGSQEANGLAPDSAKEASGGAPDSGKAPSKVETLTELDKLDKFRYEGKEWTRDELKKAMLRQQDYTKKTQELAEERKTWESKLSEAEKYKQFQDNVDADIDNVLKDPSLAIKFKELYPEPYHKVLDRYLEMKFGAGQPGAQPSQSRDPYLESRLASIELRFKQEAESKRQEQAKQAEQLFNSQVEANVTKVDAICDKLAKVYTFADEDAVLSMSEQLLNKMNVTDFEDPKFMESFEAKMDTLFKQSHEKHQKQYEDYYKEKVNKQKSANRLGKDMGAGGGTPASAPQKIKFKDVKNHILDTYSKG